MKPSTIAGAVALAAMTAQPALAESRVVQAVPIGAESVRYDRGVPTLDLKRRGGAVQVTPLGIEHGNLVFGVAVYNDGPLPVAFDRGNVTVTSGGMPVQVLSPETLAAKAKSRGIWRMVALAAIGGVAAVASANQTDTYRTRVKTPRGNYRFTTTGPSAAGQANAAIISAATGVGIASIQARLDEARARIGAETVALTTVEPGMSYGGRITLARLQQGAMPQPVAIHVDWNGEGYDFAFRVANKGTPMPVFAAATAPAAIDARPIPAVVPPAPVSPIAPPAPALIAAVAPAPAPAPVAVVVAPKPAPVVVAVVEPKPAIVAVVTPKPAPVVVALTPIPEPRPIMAVSAPVRVTAAPLTDYEQKLAAARGVHGREPKQGWTISE